MADINVLDCIITDINLNDITGIDLIRRMRDRGQHNPVLVITGCASIEVAVEAMKAGASDFLTKPFDLEDLLGKVRAGIAIARFRGAETVRRRIAAQKLDTLSEREIEVLGQVITGRTNRAISDVLGISVKTVEVHRSRIMEKTGALSLVELTRMWDAASLPAAP